ncbi:serine/threonine-protein kinase [Actinokineospora globicatena]|uniref:non-specific serine/threonine protein kinase n=1 Tax=Actinokineospora globicatena TaxID=103729 RepID=A0A9W6QJ18_9PSEU|nr:serine/threonine-protein kinase [Actinokineospora globicatena]MCP2304275.1 Serine/threonine protein kinase [Actinokineospora globicatena]GLW78363.1 serine/threonine protein kinase [Actinokineospora globicatena]GLW84972.1 serine/threonine protein kinase [Actinokineospora globicatena]GLW90971.1 serine/threonine protein kinase [Actinokineospora globicatena]
MSQDQGSTVAHGPRVVAGRYAILNELGRGGMGVVWLAEDRMIGRHVAIKELHLPDGVPASERAVFEERVLREARTAGRLNDPAVVTVYDVVQESGATYIVMELIQAPTLSDIVRERGPMPAEQVAKLAEQLLSALEAAHQAGIVHRDVKPSNIMLAANGRAKLTDFGIAQSLDDPRLTSSGILIGSPTYMAPERIRGEEAGAGSDLWALGAVLFYAIEGYNPFERPTTAATMHAILADVPHLTRAQGALASVISGLMIGTPAARLTAAQVRGLLTYVPTGPPTGPTVMTGGTAYFPHQQATGVVPTQPQAPVKSRAKLLAIGAAVALVLGAVGGFFLNQAINAPSEQEQAQVVQKFTYGQGGDFPAFSISDGYCNLSALQKNTSFDSNDDCRKQFQIQVYGTLDPGSSSAPWSYKRGELEALGESYCGWLFSTERVEDTVKKDLTYAVVLPSQATWDAEDSSAGRDHTVHCVLVRKDGGMITGGQVKTPS